MAAKRIDRGMLKALALLLSLASVAACSPASPVIAADELVPPEAAPQTVSAELPPPGAAAAPAVQPASASSFPIQGVLQPDRPLEAGDYLWEAEGAPAGPLRIVVDIEARRLYAYRGGIEIGRAHIVYGHDDKPTPTGTFKILQKNADHVSNLYDAPMPYMMRLTNDGVAIHGSEVDDAYATHGCVGVPEEFAALLFEQAKLGDTVFITNGWMTDTYAEGATEEPAEEEYAATAA
ncbi:MAG TPA: L,D-transpeptidase family protein [Allosphingosinicella sp.]|jgi:lipoprotein-anchoring transpeptidase ErfK/SrfK